MVGCYSVCTFTLNMRIHLLRVEYAPFYTVALCANKIMKFRVTFSTILIIFLTSGTSFCQRQMTKDEILKTWTALQTPTNKDSLFRFDIHKQTRATLDRLLMNGVDTLVVYSVSLPGYSNINNDSCSTMYPVDSYFFWRQQGKHFVTKVNGNCQGDKVKTNEEVIGFVSNNYPKMTEDFFMDVTYGVIADGERLRISGSVIDHEPKYEILLQLGDKFKYLKFTDNELTNKKSLFYDYNHNLTSYKLFGLINTQLKKD